MARRIAMKKRKAIVAQKPEPARNPEPFEEKIRRRAYELYELRGKQDGHDLDDWLAAEAEIAAKNAR
jgi:hypothetical protein